MQSHRHNPRADTEPEAQRKQFFEGFGAETSGATINTVYGGNRNASPLLLLHGIPETHVLWRKVAPTLAQDYFVVMTDLRGYGDSSKPPGGSDHFAYSKRPMAQDQVEVMRHLGREKFALIGHDRGWTRGASFGSRSPRSRREARHSAYCADISAVLEYHARVRDDFLSLFLLVQVPPFPETIIQNSVEYFLKCTLLWLGGSKLTGPLPD